MKKEDHKRILIFNVNWLGDVLFSTAAIRNIRRNFPRSFIACIVPSRCYPILKDNPNLDEVIIFDEKDRHKGLGAKLKFVSYLKRKKFDIAYLLHRSMTRALICWLAGIPERAGYLAKNRGCLLTRKIDMPGPDSLHRIDFYLNILEKCGLRVEDRYTEFFINDHDIDFVDKFLAENAVGKKDYLAVLNPGGNWQLKRWPKEYWARLADDLIEKKKAKVVISGSTGDIQLAREIRKSMKGKPVIACGLLNLKQLGALCKRADVFVSADSGPLHIANSVGAKQIIAIFGPTSPEITGPVPAGKAVILRKETGCKVPCYVSYCEKDNRCMKVITPEEVLTHIK